MLEKKRDLSQRLPDIISVVVVVTDGHSSIFPP